jgi:PiT family inorganic phosphate transporter
VHGSLDGQNLEIPLWVKLSAATAIGLGSYVGGWRIIKTLGTRVTDIEPPQGFSAEGAGASVLLAASYYGYPLSTTQIVSGSVFGAGIGKRLASVEWGVVGQMVAAWLLTLPAAALVAGLAFELNDFLGQDSAGPIALAVLAIAGSITLFVLAQRNPVRPADFE